MNKTMILAIVALAGVWPATAKVISSCDSAPVEVDSRSGVKYESATNVAKTVTWNAAWVGDDTSAEVVIADNGVEVKRVTGAGAFAYTNATYGTHILTYTTYIGGAAQAEVYASTTTVINCENMGIPGLQRTTFSGSAYDASHAALGAEPIVTLDGEGIYDTSLGANSTYAYVGYMYFRAGETYTFRGYFDDYSSVLVDNIAVVAKHTGDASGSVGPFAEAGWHKVDFRVSNAGGVSGPTGDVGIKYQTNLDPIWHKIEDDGSGTMFRTGPEYCGVVILKAAMRPSDPTIMDVVYKVTSPKKTVKVRALAYENGNRSFKNAVPVLTFADGTGVNVGDNIAANVEHTLSWQVAADWATDLTKVRFEVMVMDEGLLPLHFVTIPKTAKHAAIQYSDTVLTSTPILNALFWLYACQDDDLTLVDGHLSNGDFELVNGTTIQNGARTVGWIYQKMGYSTLSGKNLEYVNSAARINLTQDGIRQFAVKTISE